MKKRYILALPVALAFAVAPAAVVPATAHTGDLEVTAVCNAQTGKYDFTVNLTVNRTSLNGSAVWRVGTGDFQGTPRSADGMDRGPVETTGSGKFSLGTFSLPGSTTGYGPWVYAFNTFTDRYEVGSDGQLRAPLDGKCQPAKPKPRPFHDEQREVTCDTVTTHTRDGFYDLDFNPVANVWIERAEPTIATKASSVAPNDSPDPSCAPTPTPTPEPQPELAETGFDAAPLFGSVALLAAGVALVLYRRKAMR